jgi:AraC-like DNA-binding protein
MERLFGQYVGLSPKLACRIARFRHTIQRLKHCQSGLSWADFAIHCGYYDQAHFIREFQEFTQLTPRQYQAEEKNVAFIQ